MPTDGPRIGIPLCLDDRGRWRAGRRYQYLDSAYAEAVVEAGGVALYPGQVIWRKIVWIQQESQLVDVVKAPNAVLQMLDQIGGIP